MSASPASGSVSTAKASPSDKNVDAKVPKPAAALEEDDEFEDFPVESECILQLDFDSIGANLR